MLSVDQDEEDEGGGGERIQEESWVGTSSGYAEDGLGLEWVDGQAGSGRAMDGDCLVSTPW